MSREDVCTLLALYRDLRIVELRTPSASCHYYFEDFDAVKWNAKDHMLRYEDHPD